MKRYELLFMILSGIFLASLVIANSLVFKFFDVELPFVGLATLSVGIIPYPVTFLCTDLISELYGRKRANMVVLAGFVISLYMVIILQIGRVVPVSHLQGPEIQDHYVAVFGSSTRAIFASMVAYLAAQFIDVRVYHFWKDLTDGKHLWLRNNFSTMLSQLVDTTAVVSILFVGVWATEDIVWAIVCGYVFKILVAAVDTPFMYIGAIMGEDIIAETKRREALEGTV